MNTHSKARTTPWSRGLLVDRIQLQGWTVAHAAEQASISVRTGYKWLARAKAGRSDLGDRPSIHSCESRAAVLTQLEEDLKNSAIVGLQTGFG